MDNHVAHKRIDPPRAGREPRLHVPFTPASASCLSLVEV
jgi:hypothetical protein